MINKVRQHYPLILLFIFVNGPWISNNIRLDFIIFVLIIISELFKVVFTYRISFILLLLLIMLFFGTIFGFYLGNDNYRLYMTAYDSYLRIFIGLAIAKKIYGRYSFDQLVKYIIYILALPTYLITILWFVDAEITKEIITVVFSPRLNTWHRFSGIFGLPYLASIFLSINLFSITYLFLKKNKINLIVLFIINVFIGILTFSKTFILGLLLSILFVSIYFIRSGRFINYLLLGIISSFFIVMVYLFPELSRIESFTPSGIVDVIINRYSSSSGEVSAGQNMSKWHWFYGLGMGKSYAAMDSFFVELFSFYGIIGATCFFIILYYFFTPIYFSKSQIKIDQLYFIILLLFLFIAGIGSSSFVSDRSEVLIWTLISSGYLYSCEKNLLY